MDRRKATSDTIIAINKFHSHEISDYELVSIVCNYFDVVKDDNLSQANLKFLKYISNLIGIPHYYDQLKDIYKKENEIFDYDINSFTAELYETSLYITEESKVHKFQKDILNKFSIDKENKYFLSASTSFGKTHLVYDIIQKMNYSNVVLLFPTIALLAENLEKVLSEPEFKYFKDTFKIHTLSEIDELSTKNIFIYTPERFLSFSDKHSINVDFVFIDEAYKLDNDYLIDGIAQENERDVAYRLATFQALNMTKDILLAGPYIDIREENRNNINNSFNVFLNKNNISILNYNNYELVNKSYQNINLAQKEIILNEKNTINLHRISTKKDRLIEILKSLNKNNENAILYCSGPGKAESYAKKILDSKILNDHDYSEYKDFLEHIKNAYSEHWHIYQALMQGIGIHHGLVPKYIQKEIINLFNKGEIKFLVATTTITEGVNTTAKNLIILHDKKANKPLKTFDAKNIAGRAGRFLKHYSGRVFILLNDFEKILKSSDESIKHKNYDKNVHKDSIDLFFTEDEFLDSANLKLKTEILQKQQERHLPEELFQQFKTVSRADKILVYDNIKLLSKEDLDSIKKCIYKINFGTTPKIDWDGFQVVLNVIASIVSVNTDLYHLIVKKGSSNHSIIIYLLNAYLEDGFMGTVNYNVNVKKKNINEAIRIVAKLVYNTLKYQLVKYLGVFNIIYKYILADGNFKDIDNITGIDKLLSKLEYNAFTPVGKQISDYGVPSNILTYYEAKELQNYGVMRNIEIIFDTFEKEVLSKIEKLIQD